MSAADLAFRLTAGFLGVATIVTGESLPLGLHSSRGACLSEMQWLAGVNLAYTVFKGVSSDRSAGEGA